ncbi:STAS domain-containing protein [Polyangium sp. 6x1]|uniref:STAS domain-containing protein n=1 Tax=Polyangium sp. 6x1 TaxID=3042689 RepID=UPI0024823F32|nr:STAS domain-containing protein [Polyangium sp. 6x1]MDI1447145.1 STAS domain-containing protein [Polyangium sp. 6x1]
MVDLVPYGFLSPEQVSAQVRIFDDFSFSTHGFRDAPGVHATRIFWDEQEIGALSVRVTGPAGEALPISLEHQRFLSIVADRFGECIRLWSAEMEEERSKQRLVENDALRRDLDASRDRMSRLQLAVSELSVSITQIWDGVLFIPLAGVLDSVRAARFMEKSFNRVFEKEPYFVIVDIDGVDVIDQMTADYLVRVVHGFRFFGATGILTGIQPEVAKMTEEKNIRMDSIIIRRDLREGLRYCVQRMRAIRRREKPR